MYKRNIPTAPKAKQAQAPMPNIKTPKPASGMAKQGFTNQQTAKKKK